LRIAIIVISLKLNIDHFDGALLLLRQPPSAGWWRKQAKSLEGFFVDQFAEPVARALLPLFDAPTLGPRRDFLRTASEDAPSKLRSSMTTFSYRFQTSRAAL
jgi:hypothetical protein